LHHAVDVADLGADLLDPSALTRRSARVAAAYPLATAELISPG
jgi:hypothetical protein